MMHRLLLLLLVVPLTAAGAEPAKLPPDSVTHHTLELPGRTLTFTATAGTVLLPDTAEIGVVAYTLDSADRATRPVTFAINGGPGASSAWLQLGALGPWRVRMEPTPSALPPLLPNGETWLEFTDLVFVDPPGTGFSRALTDPARHRLWSVQGDIDGLADAIARWLHHAGRDGSPKFIAGESYGGFRAPLLARTLPREQGIGVAGLILISPKLDFAGGSDEFDPLSYVVHLPSMAAAAAELGLVAAVPPDEVEAYALGPFLADLLRGPRDTAAVERLVDHVAALTGVDRYVIARRYGQIDPGTFTHEVGRRGGTLSSVYDATVTAADGFPEVIPSRQPDPLLDGLRAPVSTAARLLFERLRFQPDLPYELLNRTVSQEWDWGHGLDRPESLTALRASLATDPAMRVLVVHGRTDLVTPYLATKLHLDQLPQIGAPGRLDFVVLPGGHMSYTRDESRARLRDAARALITR